jgi:hypothetical protein
MDLKKIDCDDKSTNCMSHDVQLMNFHINTSNI